MGVDQIEFSFGAQVQDLVFKKIDNCPFTEERPTMVDGSPCKAGGIKSSEIINRVDISIGGGKVI